MKLIKDQQHLTMALSTMFVAWCDKHGLMKSLVKFGKDEYPETFGVLRAKPTLVKEINDGLNEKFVATIRQVHPDIAMGLSGFDYGVTYMVGDGEWEIRPFVQPKPPQ